MTHRIALAVAVLGLATGCRLKDQGAPGLLGPSEYGLSLTLTATPDTVTRDGSKSTIAVTARNENSQPKPNVQVTLASWCATINGGFDRADIGGLSSSIVTTGSDGRATVTFTAPTEEEYQKSYCQNVITIYATPIGDNYANATDRSVELRLIQDPVAPVASFTYVPTAPRISELITFDASLSHAEPGRRIVDYQWDFGTGRTGNGVVVQKQYDSPNTYRVTLTVVDDYGRKGQAVQNIVVIDPNPPDSGGGLE